MKVINKTVRRDYTLLDAYEAGMVLRGGEVKQVRKGKINLTGSYVKIVGGELFLINAEIPPYEFSQDQQYDPTRTRKLLLNRREIIKLDTKLKSSPNLTIVPVSCYNRGAYFKCEIALAKSKRKWEKKRVEKDRSEAKRARSEAKESLKSSRE